MDRPERAMVISPHPDDAEIGCGGTVAHWIEKGTEVIYVLCTNGDKGTEDPEMTSEELAAIREEEQGEAAEVLGIKEVIFLRHPDGELEDTPKFRGELVRAIRKHRPEVVFTTDPLRRGFYLHRDHRLCGQTTLDAVFPYARDRLHYPQYIGVDGMEPHKVGDVLLWGAEEPDTFLDIAETLDLKIRALGKHASQLSNPGSRDVEEFVKSHAKRMGQHADLAYAEGFRRIRFRR